MIAFVGALRYEHHRSVPEIHQELTRQGVVIAERSVTNLLARYEELVTLNLTNATRLRERLVTQGHVILALDGLQPEARRHLYRFRKSPEAYLAALEEKFIQQRLPT